jgi:nitroimidazol reductase NimA-like FMN-containing flavoprotein (pyridoxamine 5'-phosphate oxidase superfamily)
MAFEGRDSSTANREHADVSPVVLGTLLPMSDGAMSRAEREAFLADVHVGVLSVADAPRGPWSLPIWYVVAEDGTVEMRLEGGSKKARLLREAGRATLVAQTETPPYQYVSVEGPVELVPSERDVRAVADRYLGAELGAWYTAENPNTPDSMTARLTPEHWNTMDFGKLLGL